MIGVRIAVQTHVGQMQHARAPSLAVERIDEHRRGHDLRSPAVSDEIGNRLLRNVVAVHHLKRDLRELRELSRRHRRTRRLAALVERNRRRHAALRKHEAGLVSDYAFYVGRARAREPAEKPRL